MSLNSKVHRICIIDDDDAVRDSLRLLLVSYRYAVTDFASPVAFLNAQGNSDFDCLLVDQHMPGMTGLELLELLRSRRVNMPAILITANYDLALTDRIRKANILAVLTKPVSVETLMAHVESAIG